jgi:isopentenyl-diphosphate delta-isomerase type 1
MLSFSEVAITPHPSRPAVENSYTPSSTDSELLAVVDESDRVIGTATRKEIHAKGLRHRAVHIVVLNAEGNILLQKRSAKKDLFPGWWDISVGGHVDAGEEYDAAVARELREEMGIVAPAKWVGTAEPGETTGWEFQRVYECRYEGELTPCEDEVSGIRWESLDTILHCMGPDWDHPETSITPAGLNSIRIWARGTGRL